MRRHYRQKIGQGDARTDANGGVGHVDPAQFVDAAEEGDVVKIALLFRHPKAHIGCAGDQGRIGVIEIPSRKICGGFRLMGGRGAICPLWLWRAPRG